MRRRRRGLEGVWVDPKKTVRRHAKDAVLERRTKLLPFQSSFPYFSFFFLLLLRSDKDEVCLVLDEALGFPREEDGPPRGGELERREADGEGEVGGGGDRGGG